MADTTSKKLLTLLRPEQPGPVRRAAALVLGEIGPREKELAVALCEQLADPDPELRAEVTKAVGKLRIESALPQLVERVQAGGPEADLAAQAAACMGAKGIRALQDLMSKVPPGLRRRIAGAMGTGGTSTAENAAVETLLDSDPGVVAAATHTLIDRAGSLSAAERRAIADRALELVQPKKGARLPTHSEVALLRVLATLRDPRAEKIWWDRAEPPHAPAKARAAPSKRSGWPLGLRCSVKPSVANRSVSPGAKTAERSSCTGER